MRCPCLGCNRFYGTSPRRLCASFEARRLHRRRLRCVLKFRTLDISIYELQSYVGHVDHLTDEQLDVLGRVWMFMKHEGETLEDALWLVLAADWLRGKPYILRGEEHE